tara:strand:+ start:582 stop:1688 length:1107 start_codon:yes stop_codon:yes gene_type:complete
MVRKTFTDSRGKRRHLTKWQQEVAKHGIRKAKKEYAGYKQVPAKATTTGHVRNVKGGTRRVRDSKVGRGKRSILTYKGDRVGTWTKSGGPSTKAGGSGLSWFMERGYGTAKKPIPKTKLTERLGIAGKGKMSAEGGRMLVPGKIGGLNTQESWELNRRRGSRTIREAEALEAEAIDSFNAATKFKDAAKKPGYKAIGNKLYHKGDLVGKRDSKGNLTRKGVNTGRGWYMERGFGTARKPVPHTELTKKLGIAGAGRQTRTPLGLFGRIKRMLVPAQGRFGFGVNAGQDWETGRMTRGGMIREAQGYNDRMDESLGMSKRESRMRQSMKDRRDESKGMEKAMGRRAYQRVKTMDRKDAEGGCPNCGHHF